MQRHTLLGRITALMVLCVCVGGIGHAADINTATEAELDSIRGIGPATSRRILAERDKGLFKDWPDLMARVKGIHQATAFKGFVFAHHFIIGMLDIHTGDIIG